MKQKLKVIFLFMFFCGFTIYSQSINLMDSISHSILELVVNDVLISAGIDSKDSILNEIKDSTIRIEENSFRIFLDKDIPLILYSSIEDDFIDKKIKKKTKKKIFDKYLMFREYIDKNNKLPYNMVECFEQEVKIRLNNKLISANYKVKSLPNEYRIIDKKICIDYIIR